MYVCIYIYIYYYISLVTHTYIYIYTNIITNIIIHCTHVIHIWKQVGRHRKVNLYYSMAISRLISDIKNLLIT